jgi:putative serine protease PepD
LQTVKRMIERRSGSSATIFVLVLVAGLIVGGLAASYVFLRQINSLKSDISNLQAQISQISGNEVVNNQTITIYQNATALSEIYEKVKDSVVLINGVTSSGGVQGSGFVYNYSGSMVVITNNHVVSGTTSVSVAFSDGNGYGAVVNGTDAYADLAVLTVPQAPPAELKPLEIVRSDTLKVGDLVIAVGNPYGLVGSMTTGVVSALGRTITEQEYTGGFAIANIIQTSTPINPGNSGGPLLNYDGKVVGITAAIVTDSQGLGFAVPSNAILKEIFGLITFGTYDGHSYLGVTGSDMDYGTAQSMHVNVTYGWLVATVVSGDPAANAGVQVDDVIIAINGTRIRNGDEMSSFLEENTLPGQTAVLTVARGNQTLQLSLTLGQRPPPPA